MIWRLGKCCGITHVFSVYCLQILELLAFTMSEYYAKIWKGQWIFIRTCWVQYLFFTHIYFSFQWGKGIFYLVDTRFINLDNISCTCDLIQPSPILYGILLFSFCKHIDLIYLLVISDPICLFNDGRLSCRKFLIRILVSSTIVFSKDIQTFAESFDNSFESSPFLLLKLYSRSWNKWSKARW